MALEPSFGNIIGSVCRETRHRNTSASLYKAKTLRQRCRDMKSFLHFIAGDGELDHQKRGFYMPKLVGVRANYNEESLRRTDAGSTPEAFLLLNLTGTQEPVPKRGIDGDDFE